MSFSRRVVVAAAVAVLGLLATTGTAPAVTVSPAGLYAATSTNPSFRLSSNGQTVTCAASRKVFSMLSTGSGRIAAGDASFTSCTNALLGAITVSQPLVWTVRAILLLSPLGSAVEFTVPADGLVFAAPGCTYRVGGTFTKLASMNTYPPTGQNRFAVARSTLAITSNDGGALCTAFPVRLAVEINEDLILDGAMTVSGPAVSPGGTYVGLSGPVSFRTPSNGQAIACSGSRKTLAMTAGGDTGIVAVGGVSFVGCTSPTFGGLSVTQPLAWPVRVVLLTPSPLGVALEFTVPTDGLVVTMPGCTYRVGGTFTKLTAVSSLPTTIQNGLVVTRSSLRITSNSGGALCAVFPVGLALTLAEALDLDRPMLVG